MKPVDGSVIEALYRDAFDDVPVKATRRRVCQHKMIRLDADSHRVFCRFCEVEVDPWEFLHRLAREWQAWETLRQDAERKARDASWRLDLILRLERNARARLKKIDPAAAKAAPAKPWGD